MSRNFVSDILNSFVCVVIGALLVIGMICMVFFNEVRPSYAVAAKSASELTASSEAELNGKAVWVRGSLGGTPIDEPYLMQDFLAVKRIVEVYAWVETAKTETVSDPYSGSSREVTTYIVERKWTQTLANTSSFNHADYNGRPNLNPANKAVEDLFDVSADLSIGGYRVSKDIGISSSYVAIEPELGTTIVAAQGRTTGGGYVYYEGNEALLSTGDVRMRFEGVLNNTDGIVLAKLVGSSLVQLDFQSSGVIKTSASIYRFFESQSMDEVIALLEQEHTSSQWMLRILGAVLMAVGFLMVLAPLSVVSRLLPLLGRATHLISLLASAITAVALTALLIVLANIINNIFTLIVAIAAVLLLIVLLVVWTKKREQEGKPC